MTYPPQTQRHMRALVKCVNNFAIQKFRSLANWIFHGVYDFVCGAVRQSLGSKVSKKIKTRYRPTSKR